MPTFSIIIATRNRPQLLRAALASVLSQTEPDREIIIVNDGSDSAHREAYARLLSEAAAGTTLRVFDLLPRPHGHGPSYALNYGVAQAIGDFVGFLDDDDTWTDDAHLERAGRVLLEAAHSRRPIDLYMTNQHAFLKGEPLPRTIWIEDLAAELRARGQVPAANGTFEVTADDLLAANGFCHLNCLIVARSLYERIDGMDEDIRWEGDRDLYYRLIDRAQRMVHHPATIARHNVPDAAVRQSVTTAASSLEKRLCQLRLLDKTVLFASHPAIRAHARRHKALTLKKIAEELARLRQWQTAAFYAREALATGPTLKWLAVTAYCQLRHLLPRRR
ncbi:glycosyltransferase [Candidatus Thiodictyon syntrophicum]|jgi:glycosyltransferase involved in cell wall biosynthesis|uniref:Glycosyltransferase 2-like domain-containing protein n=1 Tax=Candidatus Thiodictyon syntrophicum TaxID=1166950 RepID=A0A2K8UD68_9GAMM|nr:glycosyltransferase [Candidatus Thiodictyon syntrophicum]AUB83457.1 hypothetical protein THSYN_22580 [Candidatus Thiodictyon syntrophicum]